MFLYQVTTAKEIEEKFNLPEGSVRRDLSRGKFRKTEVRKSGSTWLITMREAKRIYANEEFEMINVIDEWDWVIQHVKEELKNPILADLVRQVSKNPFMDNNDIANLASVYWEGLSEGIENGKYLPFSQWFYSFYEDDIFELENNDDDTI